MINFADFCGELFQILRAYEREMVLYDETGNRVYEPQEARRFYLTSDNILISLQEKGDDSSMKLYLSPSLSLAQVKGFVETLRIMATKSNLLFHVKKFNKEIKPQDFSTKASVEENQEMSKMIITEGMYGTSKSSYLKLENARLIVRHGARVNENMIGSRGRNIQAIFVENAQGERFLFPVNVLAGGRAMAQHVNQGGNFADTVGEQIIRMANDFRNLARISHPGTARQVAQPEAFQPVRESAISAMKQTKLAFARLYEARSYLKESEKLTAGSALMETSEDLSEKLDQLVTILGEGFSEAELNTYARMVNLVESQDLAEDSSGWFVVNDEDYIKAGPFKSKEEAMQYISHGTKIMSGVLNGNQVISYERNDPEHYRMESLGENDDSQYVGWFVVTRTGHYEEGPFDTEREAMGQVRRGLSHRYGEVGEGQYVKPMEPPAEASMVKEDSEMEPFSMDEVRDIYFGSGVKDAMDKVSSQEQYDKILNHIDNVYGLDADSLLGMSVDKLHYQQALDPDVMMFIEALTQIAQYVNKLTDGMGESLGEETIDEFQADDNYGTAGLEVDEFFTFNPGDWVQVKGEQNGMTFKVVDVNGDIVTVVDAERNTGKMSAGDLEPAVNESAEPPITNDESTRQFEAWMEEFNPDTMFSKKEAAVESVEEEPQGDVVDEARAPAPMTLERMAKKVLPASAKPGWDNDFTWNKKNISAPAMTNVRNKLIDRAKAMGFQQVQSNGSSSPDGSYIGSAYRMSNPEGYELSVSENLGATAYYNSMSATLKAPKAQPTEAIEEAGDSLDINDLKSTLMHYKAQLEKTSAFDKNYGKLRGMIRDMEKQIASNAPYGKSVSTVDENDSSK